MTESRKLDIVRKLLSKAEGASTPEEAEAFTEKATELMIRYAIDEAQLAAKGESGDELGVREFVLQGYAKQKATLLTAITLPLGCKAVRFTGRGADTVKVFGWESDLAMIETLYASLEIQAMSQAKAAHANAPHIHGRRFTTSFLTGFCGEVFRRLTEQRTKVGNEAEASAPGTELALVDRSQAVERQVAEQFPKLSKSRASRVTSASAYGSGVDAGRRADLGTGNRLAGARPALAH